MLHKVELEVEELFVVKKGLNFDMESFFKVFRRQILLRNSKVFCS